MGINEIEEKIEKLQSEAEGIKDSIEDFSGESLEQVEREEDEQKKLLTETLVWKNDQEIISLVEKKEYDKAHELAEKYDLTTEDYRVFLQALVRFRYYQGLRMMKIIEDNIQRALNFIEKSEDMIDRGNVQKAKEFLHDALEFVKKIDPSTIEDAKRHINISKTVVRRYSLGEEAAKIAEAEFKQIDDLEKRLEDMKAGFDELRKML